jgi:YesN/AraC family two-component response regulator
MTNIRAAMNPGAFDFLTKPIDFLDLETTIAKAIRHIEILREAQRRQATAEPAHASLSRYFSPNLAAQLAGGDREAIAKLSLRDLEEIAAATLGPDSTVLNGSTFANPGFSLTTAGTRSKQ